MPNCDWGRPCTCSDCFSRAKPTHCCRFKCDKVATRSFSEDTYDRKGVSGIEITSYCDLHYKEHLDDLAERQRLEEVARRKRAEELAESKRLEQVAYQEGDVALGEFDRLVADLQVELLPYAAVCRMYVAKLRELHPPWYPRDFRPDESWFSNLSPQEFVSFSYAFRYERRHVHRDHLLVQKQRGRWVMCANRVRVFVEMGLHKHGLLLPAYRDLSKKRKAPEER